VGHLEPFAALGALERRAVLRAAVAQRWSPGTVLGREGVDSAAVHLLVSGLVRRHQRNAAHQNFGRSESSSHDDAASPVSVVVAAKGAAKNLKSRRASICVTPSAAAAGGVEMPKAGGRYRRHSKVFRRASLMYQNASNIAKLLGQDNEVPVRRDTRRVGFSCESDDRRDSGRAAVSRRPPLSLLHGCSPSQHRAFASRNKRNVWALSVVQGPFSVAPCQTLNRPIRIKIVSPTCRALPGVHTPSSGRRQLAADGSPVLFFQDKAEDKEEESEGEGDGRSRRQTDDSEKSDGGDGGRLRRQTDDSEQSDGGDGALKPLLYLL
jgi:hypothetical protein